MRLYNHKRGSNASTISLMLVIMLSINIALAFIQTGVVEINPDAQRFFEIEDTPYSQYITGDHITGAIDNTQNYMLDEDVVIEGGTGNIITDTYRSVKSWFKTKLEPLGFVSNLFSQPKSFLLSAGIPNSIAMAIQVIWNGIILIFITAFIVGRT